MALMASSSSLQKSIQCPSPPSSVFPLRKLEERPALNYSSWRVTAVDDPETGTETPEAAATDDSAADSFESRLSQVRRKYKSGTGKKADARKAKKKGVTSSMSATKAAVFLPPVPLKEPSSGGVKVEFGFTPYTERLNGRLAGLGLAALILVELGTGKSVIRYHTAPIIFLQLYFVAAVSAVFVKYQKERISVWPPSAFTPSDD